MKAIFEFVQKRMSWNDFLGYGTDEGIKKAYEEQTGNVADINLLLVSMLRSAGLNVYPVLSSTRSNGVPLFPTRQGFNYVVAVVNIEGVNFFLDATNKYTKPNMLPFRALNWAGRIVKEEGTSSSSVSLIPEKISSENFMVNVNIDENGRLDGKVRRYCKDYVAYVFRNNRLELDEDSYLEKLEEEYDGIEISNYTIKNKTDISKPISESFDFVKENGVELIGDKMYISPLFWLAQKTNPFKTEKRNFPVDYGYPWEDSHIISIDIPKGYKVEFIPKGLNFSLGNGTGNFLFQIGETSPGKLQLKSRIKFNQAIVPIQEYQGLKDFYTAVIEKQTEKIVLSKI